MSKRFYQEIETSHGKMTVMFDSLIPDNEVRVIAKSVKPTFPFEIQRIQMYGGLPPGYPFGFTSDDDDGDVDEVTKLRAQVASLQKTVERLGRLTHIQPDRTVFVLKLPQGEGWSQEDHNALLKHLSPTAILIAMPEDYTLEGLDDKDLGELGLKRDNGRTLSPTQAYDAMLMGYRIK